MPDLTPPKSPDNYTFILFVSMLTLEQKGQLQALVNTSPLAQSVFTIQSQESDFELISPHHSQTVAGKRLHPDHERHSWHNNRGQKDIWLNGGQM